jgi:hypothetical protein
MPDFPTPVFTEAYQVISRPVTKASLKQHILELAMAIDQRDDDRRGKAELVSELKEQVGLLQEQVYQLKRMVTQIAEQANIQLPDGLAIPERIVH